MSFQQHSTETLEKMVLICWSLWKNINEIVWNQRSTKSGDLVESDELYLNQWKSAQGRSFDNFLGFMTQADGIEHWRKPPEGSIKININAAFFEDSNCYCYFMIARDHVGNRF